MARNDNGKFPWGMPSSPELAIGPSRRNNGVGRRENIGPLRPPPRDDQIVESPGEAETQPLDSFNQGFERIMARFDRLESRLDVTDRRVATLEEPIPPDTDPPLDGRNDEDWEFGDEFRFVQPERDPQPRDFNYGRRGRGGVRGTRQGDLRRGLHRHTLFQNHGPRLLQPQPRQPTCWDPPAQRVAPGMDRRRQTCWDPPSQRNQFVQPSYDPYTGVKMSAPRFDGSDATNWLSRVQYYFDHLSLPDTDRLHYVVMLFDPPASEWVFNYRANNHMVTWQEFTEDVRQRFDPQCFQNYIGLNSNWLRRVL